MAQMMLQTEMQRRVRSVGDMGFSEVSIVKGLAVELGGV